MIEGRGVGVGSYHINNREGGVIMRVSRATTRVDIVHVTLLFGGDPQCTV